MPMPFSFIGKWNYTNPATAVAVNIPMTDRPDWIFIEDLTLYGSASAAASAKSEWFSGMAQGSYKGTGQTANATPASRVLYPTSGTTGGFTFIDQTNPPSYSRVAVTAVNGTSFDVTGTNTGLAVGDCVRLINIVGAHQISSIPFHITALISTTGFTLGMAATAAAASAGFTIANGTTGFYQKIPCHSFMYPSLRPVIGITQAVQAKVYFASPNDFTVGELVDFQIPVAYGMVQLSNLTKNNNDESFGNPPGAARVLVVTNTATESSITIDYDTTGFTAFAYPTSALIANGSSPAVCFPAGAGVVPYNGSATIPLSPPGTNLQAAFDNRAQYVMNLGLNVVGAGSSDMVVMAFKADFNNAITNA